jgi:hypothetical protein
MWKHVAAATAAAFLSTAASADEPNLSVEGRVAAGGGYQVIITNRGEPLIVNGVSINADREGNNSQCGALRWPYGNNWQHRPPVRIRMGGQLYRHLHAATHAGQHHER